MSIAQRPNGNTNSDREKAEAAFIAKKAQPPIASAAAPPENRKPTMVRIPPELLAKIDLGARRLGISRSAFIVQSAAEKLERLG